MKYKIIEHRNSEHGHLMGYSIACKPWRFIPYWREIPPGKYFYSEMEKVEHDICFLMKCNNDLKYGTEFH